MITAISETNLMEGKNLKRYLAFCGRQYYPCGGMDDFICDFDSIETAIAAIKENLSSETYKYEEVWFMIYDSVTRKKVIDEDVKDNEELIYTLDNLKW